MSAPTDELVRTFCACCRMTFGMPQWYDDRMRSDSTGSNRTFYCPNGHSLHYPKGSGDKKKTTFSLLKFEKKEASTEYENSRLVTPDDPPADEEKTDAQ